MSFIPLDIPYKNFTVGAAGSFYSMDHINNVLIEKSNDGTLLFNYLLNTNIEEVESLQFDGYYFWSLERQGVGGFRVRKWEIQFNNTVDAVSEFAYVSNPVDKFDVSSMAVEHYTDSFFTLSVVGINTFDVNGGDVIRIGDSLVLGPSTYPGFEGKIQKVNVIGKTDKTITVDSELIFTFSDGDLITWSRSFYIFSRTAPAGQLGSLYRYEAIQGNGLSLNVSNIYNNVTGSTFFKDNLLFVKGGDIIWVDPDSSNFVKAQAIDILNQSRSDFNTVYDLDGFSNSIYRLENQRVYLDEDDEYQVQNWAPNFNLNISSVVPEIYFVAVKAHPPSLPTDDNAIPDEDKESQIIITVLDQFRTPVFGRTVDISSTGGPLSSIQEVTDINGQVVVTYRSNTSVGEKTITAEVS